MYKSVVEKLRSEGDVSKEWEKGTQELKQQSSSMTWRGGGKGESRQQSKEGAITDDRAVPKKYP